MTVAHWPRRPLPSARPASVPHLEGAALAPLLEGVTENVALHRFGLFPDMERVGSAELALSSAGRGRLVVLPREDKATAMRVPNLSGQPSASGSGSAVSTLIRKVSGLRRHRPGRFLGGGDDERGRTPAEAHHIRFAQPRALGRKVSDEYTVPVCRLHHRELHRYGDEASWWAGVGFDPLPIALELWKLSRSSRG